MSDAGVVMEIKQAIARVVDGHDLTGDEAAYDCAVRAADCICDIYVGGDRRPVQAGDDVLQPGFHLFGRLPGLLDVLENGGGKELEGRSPRGPEQ